MIFSILLLLQYTVASTLDLEADSIEVTRIGVFHLGRNIFRSNTMNVFEATLEGRKYIIKYMLSEIAEEEYGVEKYLEKTGFVENVLFLSLPIPSFRWPTKKYSFLVNDKSEYLEYSNSGGMFRYQIVEQGGGLDEEEEEEDDEEEDEEEEGDDDDIASEDPETSEDPEEDSEISELPSSTQRSIKSLMKFGVQLIEGIRSIHQLGFVHGNIKRENIKFKTIGKNKLGTNDIVLASFDRARYFANFDIDSGEDTLDAASSSPWELQGMGRTRRDDVYRIIETVADFLTEGKLMHVFQGESVTVGQLLWFKNSATIFDKDLSHQDDAGETTVVYADAYARFTDLDEAGKRKAAQILTRMTKKVLKLQYDEEPKYDIILNAFKAVIDITNT